MFVANADPANDAGDARPTLAFSSIFTSKLAAAQDTDQT